MPGIRTAALLLGLLLLAVGFITHSMWTAALAENLQSIWLYLAVLSVLAAVLGKTTSRSPALCVVLLGVVPLVHFQGLGPVAATVMLLVAALGLGSLVPGADRHGPLVSCIAGLGMLAGSAAWFLPFPVFSPGLVAAVVVLITVVRARAIAGQLRRGFSESAIEYAGSPLAAFVLGVCLVAASTPAWLPVLMADDLASHLQLSTQLAESGVYRFDVGSQVWSLAPWLTDVCHGLVRLLAGKDGVATLNVAWLTMTALMVQRIGILAGLGGALSWLGAALYVSLPLTGVLTMSMQTETGTAAALAALVLVVMRKPDLPEAATVLLVAVLSGFLLGMKVVNVAFIAPPVLWLLWQWKFRLPWRAVPAALTVGGWIAGSSYAYAAWLAGNPVLPLFNQVFESPWFQIDPWIDRRWVSGLSVTLPFALTFRSNAFVEGSPGAAGFVLVALLGGVATGLADRRTRWLLLVALTAWIAPLTQLQYLRYANPAMVALIPALLAGLATLRPRLLIATAVALSAAQITFLPTASWILQHEGLSTLVHTGETAVLTRFAPERLIARYQREHLREGDRILIASGPAALAEFGRRAFVASWYDTELQRLVESAGSAAPGWAAAVEHAGANHLLVQDHGQGLREFLAMVRAEQVVQIGDARLYRLPDRASPGLLQQQAVNTATITFDVARDHAALVDAHVDIACERPLAPVSFSWILKNAPDQNGKDLSHFGWMICGLDQHASAAIAIAAAAGAGPLVFDASPAKADDVNPFSIVAHGSQARRDLAVERDLSRRARAFCPFRFCRIDGARILRTDP